MAHALLALAVVTVWGSNFVVMKFALAHVPPLTLATLRFAFSLLPAVLLVRRPLVPWRHLAAYGLLIGAGQFGLLYIAVDGLIAPGLASLVVQMQAFFTVGLAIWLAAERLRRLQWLALGLALAGLGLIAAHLDGHATPAGLLLVLGAALAWAAGNHVARAGGRIDMFGYVVWSSLFAVPPLLAAAWWFEGGPAMATAVQQADLRVWAAVLWQSVGNTLFGYAAWGWLLARHPAASVAPLSLLVPVIGMASSAWWLGEAMPPWKLAAAGLVIGALALNLYRPGPPGPT